ncbi:MAG: hypothetical protein ACP5TK_00910 [Candidatus Micrarchaeia archaeon]
MKAQFAVFESIIALVITLSSTITVAYAISAYEDSVLNAKETVLSNLAVYDFAAQLRSWGNMQRCFNETYHMENNTCINYYVKLFDRTYSDNFVVLFNGTFYGKVENVRELSCIYIGQPTPACIGVRG